MHVLYSILTVQFYLSGWHRSSDSLTNCPDQDNYCTDLNRAMWTPSAVINMAR